MSKFYIFDTDGQGLMAYRKKTNAIQDRRQMFRDGWGCTEIMEYDRSDGKQIWPKKAKKGKRRK